MPRTMITSMTEEYQAAIKCEPAEPNSRHTINDTFDQQDYDELRKHFLERRVRKKEALTDGRVLRKVTKPPAIDGKTPGYKELKTQI